MSHSWISAGGVIVRGAGDDETSLWQYRQMTAVATIASPQKGQSLSGFTRMSSPRERKAPAAGLLGYSGTVALSTIFGLGGPIHYKKVPCRGQAAGQTNDKADTSPRMECVYPPTSICHQPGFRVSANMNVIPE